MKFSIMETMDMVTVTEEILNRKLLCGDVGAKKLFKQYFGRNGHLSS